MNPWFALLGVVFSYVAYSTSVEASDYPLEINLVWSVGDRGSTTISVIYQVRGDADGVLRVEEKTDGGFLLSQGYARLAQDEIAVVASVEKGADIWSLPADVPPSSIIRRGPDGAETVLVCYSFMSVSEVRGAARATINRECPTDEPSRRAVMFGRDLIRIAQKHFPDIATSEIWRDTLNREL